MSFAPGTSPHDVDAATEKTLWSAYRTAGDVAVRERLVELYQPLVRQVAAKARAYALSVGARTTEPDDILSMSQEGLIGAIESFDPARSASFAAYARFRVMGHVKDALRDDDYLTRRERQVVQAWLRGDELSGRRARHAARLASQRPEAFSPKALTRIPEDGQAEDFVLTRAVVREALGSLGPMERAVLQYRYLRGMSMSAIATLLQVTESRVSQLHKTALGRLRELEAS